MMTMIRQGWRLYSDICSADEDKYDEVTNNDYNLDDDSVADDEDEVVMIIMLMLMMGMLIKWWMMMML